MSEAGKLTNFEVQCGVHKGTFAATSVEAAWRKLTQEKTKGFAKLARWRTHSDDGKRVTSRWFYQTPKSLDAGDPS